MELIRSERIKLAVPPDSLGGKRFYQNQDGTKMEDSDHNKLGDSTHTLLAAAFGLRNSGVDYRLVVNVRGVALTEMRSGDGALFLARGDVDGVIAGRDKIENLPSPLRSRVEIVRELGYGFCEYTIGVPHGQGYPLDFALEDVTHLRVATALPNLLRRIAEQKGVSLTIVPMEGHVETAIALGVADIIADITQTGGTMRRNGIDPLPGRLAEFQAVLARNSNPFKRGKERLWQNNVVARISQVIDPQTRMDSMVNGGFGLDVPIINSLIPSRVPVVVGA